MPSSAAADGDRFLDDVVARLAGAPGVVGVALGGSRARGRARHDSDWDLGVFVSGDFSAGAVREVAGAAGWTGHVAELGEWGPVVNGGAWLQVEGRKVDLLWRETATLERLVAEAGRGEFSVVRIPFHVAGIASYVPLGELSSNRPLWGSVPPGQDMPAALRERGSSWWAENSRFDLDYARSMAARQEDAVAGALLTRALLELAHARMCATGRWVLNEKGLLGDAGLGSWNDEGWIPAGRDGLAAAILEATRLVDEG